VNRALFTALPLLLLAAPAQAQDPRLVEHFYSEMEVVRIEGRLNIQATIMFGEDELIENVAIGDSGSWQVTPNKRANLLFVKPLSEVAATNMTVITNERTYLFDLVASPKTRPLYVLRFTYPEPVGKAADTPALAEGPNADERAAAEDPYAVIDPAALNFAWAREGNPALLPAEVYDDGEATYLSWKASDPVPAILTTNDKGEEGPVNYTVRGDVVVIHGVPGELVLRSGEDSARLRHQGSIRTIAQAQGGK
jgi:type IV secretion system protein VirB9